MPTSQPQPESASQPNSSTPPTTARSRRDEQNQRDYPSFIQQPTANPILKQPTHPLNDTGLTLRRLGLTERDIKDVPEITPRVKEAMGSVKEAISLLRGDDTPDALKFIAKWDSMSAHDQKNCKIEWVIVAASLTTRRFMELLAGAEFDHSATVSKIFVSRSQLKVLKSTVKAATDSQPIFDKEGEIIAHSNGDVKAMEIFHKITGALPTPKPSNFILNKQININPPSDADSEPRTPLQSMDSWLMEIDSLRKPTRQLEAPPVIPVEMPDSVPEIEYLDVTDLGEGV